MRLCSYSVGDRSSFGLIRDGGVFDLPARLGDRYLSLAEALENLESLGQNARGDADYALKEVRLLPPIPNCRRIICIGLNYKTHIQETKLAAPAYPILFPRYPDSLVGHGADLVRPVASEQFDFEGELAVVIGKPGRNVESRDALGHVAGYSCFNDGSLRDYQRHTSQFLPGKNFWHSGSFGPCLVTPDETGDITRSKLVTRLNGAVVQCATLDDLLFGIADIIAYVSKIWPIQSGDVIATGTPGGVGAARTPPLWMKAGDLVEVEIEGIGVLANRVVDEGTLQS